MFAAAHEECERLQRQIVRDFKSDVKGHREKLAQGHRVRKMLNELQVQSQKLVRGCTQVSVILWELAISRALDGIPASAPKNNPAFFSPCSLCGIVYG